MFGLPLALATSYSLSLSPPDQWRRLLDRHVGVALEKEATKRRHWQDDLGAPSTQFYFDKEQGKLHVGPDAAYNVQLLGVEGMDAFLWAWALTEDMRESDPALDIAPQLVCDVLKNHPELTLDCDNNNNSDDSSPSYFPEFSTTEPIPLSTTHQGQTMADVAAGVLKEDCRAVYQVPDYRSGLVYYWIVTDDRYPLDDRSACAKLSAVTQAMVHPHARHRVSNFRHAFEGYAQALDLKVMSNEDDSQWTATPRNVFWGDSILAFVDPTDNNAPKLMGLSGQYDGALHTAWVNYDQETGLFEDWDIQPSLDLATGLPIDDNDDDDSDTDEEKAVTTTPAINGSSSGTST